MQALNTSITCYAYGQPFTWQSWSRWPLLSPLNNGVCKVLSTARWNWRLLLRVTSRYVTVPCLAPGRYISLFLSVGENLRQMPRIFGLSPIKHVRNVSTSHEKLGSDISPQLQPNRGYCASNNFRRTIRSRFTSKELAMKNSLRRKICFETIGNSQILLFPSQSPRVLKFSLK